MSLLIRWPSGYPTPWHTLVALTEHMKILKKEVIVAKVQGVQGWREGEGTGCVGDRCSWLLHSRMRLPTRLLRTVSCRTLGIPSLR